MHWLRRFSSLRYLVVIIYVLGMIVAAVVGKKFLAACCLGFSMVGSILCSFEGNNSLIQVAGGGSSGQSFGLF